MRRFSRFGGLVLMVSMMWSVALADAPATRPARRVVEESKFLRFAPDDSGGGLLQTSVVTYRNPAGVTVDLVGAVHIADQSYFDALNEALAGYDSVLYEMVRPRGAGTPGQARPAQQNGQARPSRGGGGGLAWIGILQRFLRDNLELKFQLEEIDYERPNFVHADLELEEFLRLQQERGESFMRLMLQTMMREMGRNPTGAGQPNVAEILMALQAPDRARQLKLVLARQFSQMEDVMAGFEGPKGSVIIGERNRAALRVLADRIEQGERRIAIFYGAGHLPGMEKILLEEMGFEQAGEPRWLVAWDMSAPATQPATLPAR